MLARTLAAQGSAEATQGIPTERRRIAREQGELALEVAGDVRAEPRVGLELECVGGLVQGDPATERVERQVEGTSGDPDVLLDEEQPSGRRLGRQERQVVLAEDLLAHESQQESQLAGRDVAVCDRHRRLAQASAGGHDLVEQLTLDLGDQRGERGHVGPDPTGAVDDAGPIDHARQLGAKRGREARHDRGHRGLVGGFGRSEFLLGE